MSILFKTISTFGVLLAMSSSIHAESLYSINMQARLIDSDGDGVIDVRDRCSNTEKDAAVDNYGCPDVSEKLLTVQLNILFDSGQAIVKPSFYPELKKLADFLNANPASSVVIEGHTDDVGSSELNHSLSQKRANAIADVLVDSFRIRQNRVKGIGYGEDRPIESNDTPEGREKNRRVVAEVFARQEAEQKRWTIYSVDQNSSTAYKSY
ncbi:OmpA family protein [Marinomonas dokdonensis]|uniref:OmpA family protein n=1 Tax=Marinomonas dokdonensis TaxID=328224 RepID=UPI0040559967